MEDRLFAVLFMTVGNFMSLGVVMRMSPVGFGHAHTMIDYFRFYKPGKSGRLNITPGYVTFFCV